MSNPPQSNEVALHQRRVEFERKVSDAVMTVRSVFASSRFDAVNIKVTHEGLTAVVHKCIHDPNVTIYEEVEDD